MSSDYVTIDLEHDWQITVVSKHDEVMQTAVSELQQMLQKINGRLPPLANQPNRPTLSLENLDCGGEGYFWQASSEHIQIQGNSQRDVLYGVYHFLQMLGCDWLAPGDLWTVIPSGHTFKIAASGSSTPAFAGRCLIIGHHAFMEDIADWIIWAARNRYNNIFLHVAPDDVGGGSIPEWFWQTKQKRALKLLRERGMVIEYGGHGLPTLLPRKLFKQMPEAFREENGRRTPKYNFCPSSEAGIAIVRENGRRYFAERAGYNVYHVWADDIPGGGWCSCERCANYSVSDQLLLATNALAEVLAEQDPAATISFIAYLDTEAPPTQIPPHPNVSLLWAPRMRNYGRSLDDSTCSINSPYYTETLAAQISYFGDKTAVFEYYSDAILFKSVLPILPQIMQEDLIIYQRLGVQTMQTLMTGTRPWATAQLTNWLFGQLTWQPAQELAPLVARFCHTAFGEAGAKMVAYYELLEKLFTAVLQQTPDQRENGFQFSRDPWKIVKQPVADMEDPIHATAEILQTRAAQLPQLLAWLNEAAARLATAQTIAPHPRLAAEAKAFGLVQPWLRFASYRLALYAALKTNDSQLKQLWQQTKAAYDEVQRWGAEMIEDPLYRQNFQTMQFVFWELRLRRIWADRFRGKTGRFLADVGTLLTLVMRFGKMVWGYKRAKRTVARH